jgi:predicted RNA binding protein YcfA (HicA-like mRNA interferase family)
MIKIIEDDGWYLKAHNATSHRQDLDHFVVNSILKQAGLK